MHRNTLGAVLVAASVALGGAAFAHEHEQKTGTKQSQTPEAKGGGPTTTRTDDQKLHSMLSFIHAENENHIRYAKFASDHAQRQDVKQLADRTAKELRDRDDKLTSLAKKKNIDVSTGSSDDPLHATLRNAHDKFRSTLESKKGHAFDVAYVGPQALETSMTLAAIEEAQKITKDNEVKSLLDDMHKWTSNERDQFARIEDKLTFGTTQGPSSVGGGPSGKQQQQQQQYQQNK